MFFQEKIKDERKETAIPNSFFTQVLPILGSEMTKIFMYAYYLSKNPEIEDVKTNEDLAKKLNLAIEDILKAWDFFEACGLIIKHRVNQEVASEFSIEFKDLHKVAGIQTEQKQEVDHTVQSQEYRKMYDKIESITGMPLLPHDARKINEVLREYNLPKELVVEAFKLNLYRKKSSSVSLALGILRNWYLDGIRTTQDLETTMKHKEQRYLEYKSILQGLGEYRLPTKPEEEMMDSWLDQYNFTVEVILSALAKTTSIKSPNMKYLNGILTNWNDKIKEENPESIQSGQILKVEKEPRDEYTAKILKMVGFTKKSMTREELKKLNFLYEHYHSDDVELGAKWLKAKNAPISLDYLARFLYDSNMEKDPFRQETKDEKTVGGKKVGIEEIEKLKDHKPKVKAKTQDKDPQVLGGLEARIAQRYQDRKKNKVKND